MCVISLMLKNDIFYKSLQWSGARVAWCWKVHDNDRSQHQDQDHNNTTSKTRYWKLQKTDIRYYTSLLFWISVSTERFILFSKVHSCHLQQYCDHVTPLTGIFSEHRAHDRVAWWMIDSLETKAISSQMAPAPAPAAAPHRGLERRRAAERREDDRTGGGPRLWRSAGRRLY